MMTGGTTKINSRRAADHARNARLLIHDSTTTVSEAPLIILGIILVIIGVLAGIPILTTIGVILVVIGAVLFLLGSTGRAVGGRAHWY